MRIIFTILNIQIVSFFLPLRSARIVDEASEMEIGDPSCPGPVPRDSFPPVNGTTAPSLRHVEVYANYANLTRVEGFTSINSFSNSTYC